MEAASAARNNLKASFCGYDSKLHAKICSTNNVISNPILAAHTSKLLRSYNNAQNAVLSNNSNAAGNRISRNRYRHHQNEFTINASPQVQGYTKLLSTNNTTTKLNTAILNQLNPQLTPEQKLSRTKYHVEKWLTEDQANVAAAAATTAAVNIVTTPNILTEKPADSPFKSKNINCKETNLCKDDSYLNANNISAIDRLKLTDKISKSCTEATSPKKAAFKKEILLSRKTKAGRSADKQQQQPQPQQRKPHQPPTDSPLNAQKENIMDYSSIIIDPSQSECENLLRASSDESSSQIEYTDSLTTIRRYVHEHIHHHYYHFEAGGNVDVDLADATNDS